MPNLSIKNVPADVVQRLRTRATANHRSLQGDMKFTQDAEADAGSLSAQERANILRHFRKAES